MIQFDHFDRFCFRDQAFFVHIDGDVDGGNAVALAVSRLQDEQLARINGKLDVLHVLEVHLELIERVLQTLRDDRHFFKQRGNRFRRSNTRDDVFSLRVDEIFTKDDLLASIWSARKAHASTGSFTKVTKDHGLDVDGGAAQGAQAGDLPVRLGSWLVPRLKDCFDGEFQLHRWVRRERPVRVNLQIHLLVRIAHFHQILRGQLGILLDAFLLLDAFEFHFELTSVHLENDRTKHIQQTSVRVVREPLVRTTVRRGNLFTDRFVQTNVQNGFQHPRHGHGGAGSYREQKRFGVAFAAKLLPQLFFGFRDGKLDVFPNIFHRVRAFNSARFVRLAHGRRNGKSRRHGNAQFHHLRQQSASVLFVFQTIIRINGIG